MMHFKQMLLEAFCMNRARRSVSRCWAGIQISGMDWKQIRSQQSAVPPSLCMSCRVQLLPHSLLALTAVGRMRAKHPSKSHRRNAEGNLDHCLMIVYIHCQYPSVTGCEADIVQQLIPRDKKETESRFRLQHKILTADDAVVCFVKCYKISERNT